MLITSGRCKRVVVLLQLKHMSDQELPTTIIDEGILRRFHHGSFGSWPAITISKPFYTRFWFMLAEMGWSWNSNEKSPGSALPLAQPAVHQQRVQARLESRKLSCGTLVGQRSNLRGFGAVRGYRSPSQLAFVTDITLGQPTFFITPTASSVCPTNSSSACSISTLASSDAISSSCPALAWPGKCHPPALLFAFAASSISLEFSTLFLARVANMRLVFRVVLQPAKNRLWICASCARRASPTRSLAKAYFSRAVARGSSPAPVCCCCRSWLLARLARAIAWGKVLGCGFAEGGAVRAAWASAGVVAAVRSWTFSLTVRERSPRDYIALAGLEK